MHKHTMIPNPDGSYELSDPPSIMQPLPSVMPQININLESTNGIETLIGRINEAVYPGIYGPRRVPEEMHDKWGTPFECSQMPDTIDVRDRNNTMMMTRTVSPMSMLHMRMKWGPYCDLTAGVGADASMPFDHLSIHLGAEKAIIFVVTRGDPVTIEDDAGLFPSDALITQLKMLEQRQTATAQSNIA